jgi:xylose isomerase
MRTYLILKEKVAQFNADPEIQERLSQINAVDSSMEAFQGPYTAEKAAALKMYTFNRTAISQLGLQYEKLDQLTVDLLLGVR